MAQDITEDDVANFENNPNSILAEITGLDPESISGFEGSGIELGIDGSVTKGAITLNANEIPSSITGIEYDQKNQNIILTYENGAKVSIAQGTLTETNKLTGVTNGDVKYGDIDLNVDKLGTINVNKEGVMKVSGGASANIEDKEFSSGTFQKLGEDTFDIKGKVKFGDTHIETNAPVEIKFQDDTTTTSTTTTTTSTDDPSKGKNPNSVTITNREGGVGVTGDLDGDNAEITVDAPPGTGIEVNVDGAVVNTRTKDAMKFNVEEAAPIANGEIDGQLVKDTASEEVTEYRTGRRGRRGRVRVRVGREYVPGRPVVNLAIAVGRVGRGLRGGRAGLVGRVGKGAGRVVGKVGKGAAIVAGRAGRGALRVVGKVGKGAGRVVKNIRPGRAVVNIFRRSQERPGPVKRLIFKRLRRV